MDGFCGVASDHELNHASMSNLSTLGLQLEHVLDPAMKPIVQLEIELPGLDEVVWTSAIVTRAVLTPLPCRRSDGQLRFWMRAGLRLGATSRRERRLLHDYVIEQLVTRRSAAIAERRRLD